jgi:ABC-type glycerol-3-phosphate transport system substrate-binding protein
MRRPAAVLASALLATVLLSGCGESTGSSADGDAQPPEFIKVTITGDSVTPNGERVEVGVGQPIRLAVTADAPGEIHVHSSPEQEFEYDKGSSTLDLAPIPAPGVVEVESHTLDKVIVSLQAR